MPFFAKFSAANRRPYDTSAPEPQQQQKISTYKRQSLAVAPDSNFTAVKSKADATLPKLQPPDLNSSSGMVSPTAPNKSLPAVREITQGVTQLPAHDGGRRRMLDPSSVSSNKIQNPRPVDAAARKQHIFRRHESQNVIPSSKFSPGATMMSTNVVKNSPIQKFVAQTTDKVSKSSTSPNLVLNTNPTGNGDPAVRPPRFRTDPTAAAAPLKYSTSVNMRILGQRRESRKNLEPHHQSVELGSRRLLEANRVLRKYSSGTDGGSSSYSTSLKGDVGARSFASPIDEFPDPFSVSAELSRGDRKISTNNTKFSVGSGAVTTGPDKPWMSQSVPAKPSLFAAQKGSPFLIRPSVNAQFNESHGKNAQLPVAGSDRRTQEPSWWDKWWRDFCCCCLSFGHFLFCCIELCSTWNLFFYFFFFKTGQRQIEPGSAAIDQSLRIPEQMQCTRFNAILSRKESYKTWR